MLNKFICFFAGHRWNGVHGWNDEPIYGAKCYRCGKKNTKRN